MKKIFFLVISVSLLFIGCKQKDSQPPLIFLIGDNPQTVILNSWWEDPGATVDDNFDGSIPGSSITVTHDIVFAVPAPNSSGTTKLTGTYTVTYTVKDKAENVATATRTVIVRNSAQKYATKYETDINSDVLEQIVKDTVIASQDITIDTRINFKAWFPKLGGKINTNPNGMTNTIRVSGYFVADSVRIPRQTYYIKELEGIDSIPYLYQVMGTAGQCHISDTIDPSFVIKYIIEKYRISTTGQWDTLGHLWERFRDDDVIETWVRF